MNETKKCNGWKIAVSVLIVLLVAAVVLYLYKTNRIFPTWDEGETTALSTAEETTSVELPAVPLTDESDDLSQSVWMPSIEYDAYAPSEIDQQNFNKTVILGNSQAQALANFGLIKNADFVTKVGLAINKVLDASEGEAPIEKLRGKSYEKAVFVFGENELGWPYPANFIKIYKRVIARVREMNPGVEIYVQGIFPVTAAVSEKSTTGITNENVRIFNEALEKMCGDIDATFMPVTDAFRDETGVLPEGAAFDGVHFGYDLCKVWAGDLSAYIGSGEEETTSETEPETEPETTYTTSETTTDLEAEPV